MPTVEGDYYLRKFLGVWIPCEFRESEKRKMYTPGKSLCPFWDGENVTLSKVVGDLQRSGIKRSRLEPPGPCFL